MSFRFPDGFMFGAATAAHQVEGGNWNSDWWAWEHSPNSPCAEPSGDACDHYHRYPDDIALLHELGFGAYRFSIEWCRVEPEENEFSVAQLDHYRRMLAACREHGLRPVVTFHHFTTPRWVAAAGGWDEPTTAERFARYCERAMRHLGDLLEVACTINEPNIVSTFGYLTGLFPPGRNDPDARLRANDILVDAHRRAVEVIKSSGGGVQAGLTLAMTDYQAVEGGEEILESIRGPMEDAFLDAARSDDFVGVQTYTRSRVGPRGELEPPDGAETTLMGYEFYPQALDATIRRAWSVTEQTPIIVTESGIGTRDDSRRIEYMRTALGGVRHCIEDAIDVRGYFCWSALDNFEWALGYGPTFGIIGVDRLTQKRTPKPSAHWMGKIAHSGIMGA